MLFTRGSLQCILIALFFVLCSSELMAQNSSKNGEEFMRSEALSDPSPGAFNQRADTILTLISGKEDSKLLGRLTWANQTYTSIFSLEASSTLEMGSEEVELLNLDGLGGGDASIQGKHSWSWSRKRKVGKAFLDLCDDIRPKVKAQCKALGSKGCSEDLLKFIRNLPNEQVCDDVILLEALPLIKNDPEIKSYSERYRNDNPVAVQFLTVSAGASNVDFKYVDLEGISGDEVFSALEEQVKQESELNTSLGLKWSNQFGNHFISVGYEYRNTYRGGSSAELCAPLEEGKPATRCFDTTVGAPMKIDQNLGMAEYRTYLSENLGLKLQAFFIDSDFRRKQEILDEWEFHALLYMFRDKEKGLNGGLDVFYDTAFKEFNARVFIGQSFNLFE